MARTMQCMCANRTHDTHKTQLCERDSTVLHDGWRLCDACTRQWVPVSKTVRVNGRSYTAYLVPGTEQHPVYTTGDVDAAARAISQRRASYVQELRNDPNLARWKTERELDAYEAEAETWRRTA